MKLFLTFLLESVLSSMFFILIFLWRGLHWAGEFLMEFLVKLSLISTTEETVLIQIILIFLTGLALGRENPNGILG